MAQRLIPLAMFVAGGLLLYAGIQDKNPQNIVRTLFTEGEIP